MASIVAGVATHTGVLYKSDTEGLERTVTTLDAEAVQEAALVTVTV